MRGPATPSLRRRHVSSPRDEFDLSPSTAEYLGPARLARDHG
jgi:hypothetical protein